jgi:hypothetical protein
MPPTPIAIAITSRLGRGVISVGIRNLRAMRCMKQPFRDRTMKVEMACPGYQVNAVTARDWTSRSGSDLSVPKLRSEYNEARLR